MKAGLIDESALPTVTPTAGPVSDSASALRTATAQVQRSAGAVRDGWHGIGGVLSSPGATDTLPDAMHGATEKADALGAAGAAVASALDVFAEELGGVRRTRRALLADIDELRAKVAASDSDEAVPEEYRALNDDLRGRARRLNTRWRSAQDDLGQAIRGQIGGGPLVLPELSGNTLPAVLTQVDFAAASRAFQDAARLPMFAALAAKGPDALARWAADHPGEAQRMLDHPPSTGSVKAWWTGLGADERTALVTGLSAVVGNLNGVRYADRGRANQHTLDVELPKARDRYDTLTARISRGEPLSAAEGAEYRRLADRIGALEALDETLLASTPAAPRTIVALTLGEPPLAAVAVGDLDTASNVTVDVPGMGNTVAGSMRAWAGAAENLSLAQRFAADQIGVRQEMATVAWIGYDTPDMPPSAEVLASAKAEAGARNLSGFLGGVSGTRSWSGGSHLSVVAHSYGTTTATLAVAKTPVANLTLLASAGIDPRVPDVHAVEVPQGHVWASQGKEDYIANIGRGAVEVPRPAFGGDQPINTGNPFTANRGQVLALHSTHRLNPGDPSWGARTFSSNTETIDGHRYPGTDDHGATPATEARLRSQPVTEYGYLDAGTSPLRNTGYTSLGYTPTGTRIP
ncbi:alpha/beta hydrolase [Curtobacterium sp. ZW137]|uniref:alpha/beta hydrolase n=1 Tax=Curtobacterium sp. ZW137 TaxID=2485104 RepID=UPI000F4B854E|nr:alpha/beta hydrolase [Curtobacterium sp. ZW137]ROP64808.1 alpha/beta hydrolase family protein [Curtobacterium sp. ZW137]